MFNYKKLELARKRRSLTKKVLAESLNLSIQTLSEWENGKTEPKTENLIELSKILKFPIDFFCDNREVTDLVKENVSFRALTKMKASDRELALSCGSLAIYFDSWVSDKFNLPKPNLPNLDGYTPEQAATEIRKYWNINDEYIDNTIYLLEKNGIRVYSLCEDKKDFDAFSTWVESVPYVFLNTTKSPERSRFDAMHELGHLVLHKNKKLQDKKIEDEANQFASCILMPEESVKNYDIDLNIGFLIQLKQIWKVSLKALVYRLYKLDLITEWYYRLFMVDINKRGYNTQEPASVERETSIVLTKIFDILKTDNITIYDVANELKIPVHELNSMIFNMFDIFKTIDGLGIESQKSMQKPNLRII